MIVLNTAGLLEHMRQCFKEFHSLLTKYDNPIVSDNPMGSYEQINTLPKQSGVFIGINSYIVGLINAGE